MNCETTRDWLLDSATPAPAGVEAHLRACADCRTFREDSIELERRWRAQPLPPRAESSKQAFLARLTNPPTPVRPAGPARRGWMKWTVAAMLFAVAGAGFLLYWPGDRVEAHPDVLDQLIDWNLDLTEAPDAGERQKIYAARHEALQVALKKAKLDQRDRELGELLLANGVWMAENDDPVEELDRYHQVADDLLDGVRRAGPDAGLSNRRALQFAKVSARGIDRNVARVKPERLADANDRVRFNKLMRVDAELAERALGLMERAPDMTKRELKHALDLSAKRHKHKKSHPAPHEVNASPLNP